MSNITELDKELLEKGKDKKMRFINDMIQFKALTDLDEKNDYPFFLYIASIMNFVEYHNGGCLTELGMKSLEMDISPFIKQLQNEDEKLSQKNLIRLLLNLLNSYATSFLVKGLFELAKEEPEKFFAINEFPSAIRDDFEKLESRVSIIIPKLKEILDVYCPQIEGKYKTVFLEEKTKGFYKPIFDPNALRIKTNQFPTELEKARECK